MTNFSKFLIIYFGDDWGVEVPFLNNRTTGAGYEAWTKFAKQKGVELVRSSIRWFDAERGVFSKYWVFLDGKWQKKEQEYKPDVVFNKVKIKETREGFELVRNIQKVYPMFNGLSFTSLFDNKVNQYVLFSEDMPKSFLAIDKPSLKAKLRGWEKDKRVVLKPLDRSGGFGIVIDEVGKINIDKFQYPLLGQEFLEADASFLGFSDQLADLRLVFVGNELCYAASRLAPEGSLFTNFHQGAVLYIVDKDKIPEDVWQIAKRANSRISFFRERIYSLDFLCSKTKGSKLIEMNTKPGIDYFNKNNYNIRERFFDDVFKAIDKWLG